MALTITYRGTANSTTSNGSLVESAVTIAAGSAIIVAVAADNSKSGGVSAITTCTDSVGNTYTKVGETNYSPTSTANDGATLAFFLCLNASAISNGSITISFSPSVHSKAMAYYEVTKTGNTLSITNPYVGTGVTGTGGAFSQTTAETLVAEDILISGLAVEDEIAPAGSLTGDSDTTNGTWTWSAFTADTASYDTSMKLGFQYKVITGSGTQTCDWDPIYTRDAATNYIVLRGVYPISAAEVGSFTLTGATSGVIHNRVSVTEIGSTRTYNITGENAGDFWSQLGPSLISPANGAVNVTAPITFEWAVNAADTDYILEIATDSGFAVETIIETIDVQRGVGATETYEYDGSGLSLHTQYFWRVRALRSEV